MVSMYNTCMATFNLFGFDSGLNAGTMRWSVEMQQPLCKLKVWIQNLQVNTATVPFNSNRGIFSGKLTKTS